tara:strand:- start:594 stop:830 length:237 start_codon:yes stop_codon:yes gene_type:complete
MGKNQKKYLAFTNSTFAYDSTKLRAIEKLRNELKKQNREAISCWLYDSTRIPKGKYVIHSNGIVSWGGNNYTTDLIKL